MVEVFPLVPNQYSLRFAHRQLTAEAALASPPDVLTGVTSDAVIALAACSVLTVADLARSLLFAHAVQICRAAAEHDTALPRDILRKAHDVPVHELPGQPLDVLASSATRTELAALGRALGTLTVHDLAAWAPYHASRLLLASVNGAAPTDAIDEAPQDLLPTNGAYPTERVQYEVLTFTEELTGSAVATGTDVGATGPRDVTTLVGEGFQRPGVGAILTYTQSWFAKGLALGSLIHSVALGPGESTRIAMVDWSRRTGTSASEEIVEGERLESDLVRNRAITEITNAVAKETQTGQSTAMNFAHATQYGEATGNAGIDVPNLLAPSPSVSTRGTSFGQSNSTSFGTAWSTSSGDRSINADASQQIADSTHQASHLERSRRASIVREVSQSESEKISTRTLTNYNHMHALTVQYYEVVQLYRSVLELTRAVRCLYLPLALVTFTPHVLERYRAVIAAAGLVPRVRALAVAPPGRIGMWSTTRSGRWNAERLAWAAKTLGTSIGDADDDVLNLPTDLPFSDVVLDGPFTALAVEMSDGEVVRLPLELDESNSPNQGARHVAEGARSASERLFGERLTEVRKVSAIRADDAAGFAGIIRVKTYALSALPSIDGPFWPVEFPVQVVPGHAPVPLFSLAPTMATPQLQRHVEDNRLHYSQAIWRSLSPAEIGALLADAVVDLGNGPASLTRLVDPVPVTLAANYLVFRLSGESSAATKAWFDDRGIVLGPTREDLVPVPSGGVFAEAVLGRFNSAEKLDLTRFWNWHDSPIPITAPEIAPVATGSRGEPDQTVPGQLGQPVLNIVNAPAAPDPQGMTAVLSAIQNGSMFRDMSGLAGTIGLVRAGLEAAQQGATAAGAQAGENAAVAAELGAKVAELAAKVVAAYFTGGASLAGEAANLGGLSGQGAKLNHARDIDRRDAEAGASGAARAGGEESDAGGRGSGEPGTSGSGAVGSRGSGAPGVGDRPSAGSMNQEKQTFEAIGGGGGVGGLLGTMLSTALGQTGSATGSGGSTDRPPERPSLRDRGFDLGRDAVLMESYQRFQGEEWMPNDKPAQDFYWSKNAQLRGAVKMPVPAPTTAARWNALGSTPKMVLGSLGGFNANTLNPNAAGLAKVKAAYAKWPGGHVAVYQGGGSVDTNSCNLYVGEALFRDGILSLRSDRKYWSANEIWKGLHPRLRRIDNVDAARGDIAAWGKHVEIVTEVNPSTNLFCTIGGYRRNPPMGTVMCGDIDPVRHILTAAELRIYRVR
ncbi:hypothetical protein [Cellulomonas xiejunii]|uniref:Uncharacterized protein n=1 Tax=Cellulomonas xiejunii TaxID=2968083 RepID=A0ABY5KN91_9CELL|nr:hypothetical protein [Cellulomonas xiejunii]MCC2321253.1 hypothetical protein [Cellulomonas xiejunii]UUI71840.1 hypothetical protein NP048_18970 [Cellulomonas xiejunii]